MKSKRVVVMYDNQHTEARRAFKIGVAVFVFMMLGAGVFALRLKLGGAL